MGYICAKNNANYPQNEAGMMVLRKKCHAVTKIRFSNITIYIIQMKQSFSDKHCVSCVRGTQSSLSITLSKF